MGLRWRWMVARSKTSNSAARTCDAERHSLRGSSPRAPSLRLKVAGVTGTPGRQNDPARRKPHMRFPGISRNHTLSAICVQGRNSVNVAGTGLSAGSTARPQH